MRALYCCNYVCACMHSDFTGAIFTNFANFAKYTPLKITRYTLVT